VTYLCRYPVILYPKFQQKTVYVYIVFILCRYIYHAVLTLIL